MVYLELFHGRHSPDEKLDDWGFEGPILGPFPFVQITYGSNIQLAGANLGFDKDGYVQFAGAYYGDISTFSFSEPKELDCPTKDLLKRIKETQEVFLTDPTLLVADEREWVKLYCEWRLKNGINPGKYCSDDWTRK